MRTILLRLLLTTFGRLSDGVGLCFADGPTAGTTLAYAYRNEPHGRFILGKWIDRRFLNYAGWRRARQRLLAVQSVLQQTIAEVRREGLQVQLLDIASGPASYLEAVFKQIGTPAAAVCRDLSKKSIAAGKAWVAASGIPGIRFELGDALDRASIMVLRPRPTIIISVGLYELLDDEAFCRSIAIIAEALCPGGQCIVAHQIAHVDPGIVSELFVSRSHRPAQLYLRSAAQLESALRHAGLRPINTLTCGEGWYIITTARKDADGPRSL